VSAVAPESVRDLRDLGISYIQEVHWELTNHCNFRCVHCYLAPDPRPELGTAEVFRLLDEMQAAGVLMLTLTGGEPLLRRDFSEIYRRAHGLGFLVNVFTNGSRITEEHVRLFRELPPRQVEITVNGITKETFERVTAKEGSHAEVFAAIRNLHEAGVRLLLKTNGMSINAHEALAVKGFARSLPNAFYKFDTAIMPRRDHDPAPTRLRLSPREILTIYAADPEMEGQIQAECASLEREAPAGRRAFQCSAGEERFHLSAWGDLHPCHTVRPIRVSLRENSFGAAVGELRRRVRELTYPPESKCGSCRIFAQCDSCPGLAHLEGRSPVLPAKYHCEVAHEVVAAHGSPEAR
jgi:radical SAM protein with 4Fe4S-binding SPASM domain